MIGCTFIDCALEISFTNNGKQFGAANCFDNYTSCYDFGADIKVGTLEDIPQIASCFATKCFPSGANPLLYDFVNCLNQDCDGGKLQINGASILTISLATLMGVLFLIFL